MLFVFFWLSSCRVASMLLQMALYHSLFILLNDWVVLHLINVPHLLHPFICQWTFKLLPCFGYCGYCCYDHWDACIFLNYSFVQVKSQEWNCWIIKPLQYSCLEISWTEELGRLQSMGSLLVGHNWATSLSLFTFVHWRRKWQPTPVFLPGESQGRGSLVGCRLWGRTESDTTEAT